MRQFFRTLARKFRACFHLLASDYYLVYTSQEKARNLYRVHTSERIIAHDIWTVRDWCNEIEADNTEAEAALDTLLNLNPGIEPAE
jgi:hypothetical protein